MGRQFNLILYAFIAVCVIKIELSFFGRYLIEDIVEVHDKYVLLVNEVDRFKHFDDSLAGNENFRKKFLDSLIHPDQILQVKQEIGKQLERKISEFDKQNPNRAVMLTTYKIVNGLKISLNVLFVCLGLSLLIRFVRRR